MYDFKINCENVDPYKYAKCLERKNLTNSNFVFNEQTNCFSVYTSTVWEPCFRVLKGNKYIEITKHTFMDYLKRVYAEMNVLDALPDQEAHEQIEPSSAAFFYVDYQGSKRKIAANLFMEMMLVDILDTRSKNTCTVYSIDTSNKTIVYEIKGTNNKTHRYKFETNKGEKIPTITFLTFLQEFLKESNEYVGVCKLHFETLLKNLGNNIPIEDEAHVSAYADDLSIKEQNSVNETIKSTIGEEHMTIKVVKETKMNRQKNIAIEIAKRTALDTAMQVGQQAVLELLSLLGVRKTSKIYRFFASDFANGVLKASVGLFLMYCPFTQDEKYQLVAEELLTQAGVSSAKEALNVLLAMLAPQSQKFVELISNLNSEAPVRIAESTDPEKKARVQATIKEKEEIEHEPLIGGNLATA